MNEFAKFCIIRKTYLDISLDWLYSKCHLPNLCILICFTVNVEAKNKQTFSCQIKCQETVKCYSFNQTWQMREPYFDISFKCL